MPNTPGSSVVFVPRLRTLAAALSIALAGGMAVNADAHPERHRLGKSVHLHNVLGKDHPRSHYQKDVHGGLHHLLDALNRLKQSAAGPSAHNRAPATRVVTSHADSGAGSLRDALASAVDGDVIDLGNVHGRISLSSALWPSADVTIRGPGQGQLTIDGGHQDRVFATGHSLKVSNVTIANGAAPHATPIGGCLYVGGSLQLQHVTLTGCTAGDAYSKYAYGGAIAAAGYTSLKYSTVSDSSATAYFIAEGGGIASVGQPSAYSYAGYGLTLYQSTVSGNSVNLAPNKYNLYAAGGGVATAYYYTDNNAYVGVIYSTISNNNVSAPGYYGPTYSYYGHGRGGGLWSSGQEVITAASTISGNSVSGNGTQFGGGMYVGRNYYGGGGETYMIGSRVTGNSATSSWTYYHAGFWSYGGGIMSAGSTALIARSTISGNAVSSDCEYCFNAGGGVDARGDLSLQYSAVSGNTVASTNYYYYGRSYGGGAFGQGPDGLNIVNSTISGNSATGSLYGGAFGGGVAAQTVSYYSYSTYSYYYRPTPLTIANSTIAFNSALYGGGVLVGFYQAPTTLTSTIVANNTQNAYTDIDSFDYNTIAGDHNIVTSASTVLLPGDTIADDPMLLPLAYNGGPTQTHSLDPASPAIDAGSNPNSLQSDQRGCGMFTGPPIGAACGNFPRELGAAADIGAFELDPDRIFVDGFDTL